MLAPNNLKVLIDDLSTELHEVFVLISKIYQLLIYENVSIRLSISSTTSSYICSQRLKLFSETRVFEVENFV